MCNIWNHADRGVFGTRTPFSPEENDFGFLYICFGVRQLSEAPKSGSIAIRIPTNSLQKLFFWGKGADFGLSCGD